MPTHHCGAFRWWRSCILKPIVGAAVMEPSLISIIASVNLMRPHHASIIVENEECNFVCSIVHERCLCCLCREVSVPKWPMESIPAFNKFMHPSTHVYGAQIEAHMVSVPWTLVPCEKHLLLENSTTITKVLLSRPNLASPWHLAMVLTSSMR